MTEGPVAPDPEAPRRVSRFLASRSRVLSVAIVVAVVVPVIAVAVQISPSTDDFLPLALDFRMWDTQTLEPIRLSDFRGTTVLLDFMATWCISCNESMPALLAIRDRYSPDSLVMLSVTADRWDSPDKMERYRTDFNAGWTFAVPLDTVEVSSAYDVSAYPTTVVVNADGRMTFRAVGLVSLETLVTPIEQALGL